MQVIHQNKQYLVLPTPSVKIFEYPMQEKSISGAVAEIHGRYPGLGFAVNEVCKELVYILSGNGMLATEKQEVRFSEGDSLFIEHGEKFYWLGNFRMYMATTPKFNPKQHKIVK